MFGSAISYGRSPLVRSTLELEIEIDDAVRRDRHAGALE